MRVLLTGATGFVGSRLFVRLSANDRYDLRIATRKPFAQAFDSIQAVEVREIGPNTEWDQGIQDVQVVIHVAARAHVMRESVADPLLEYRYVNTAGTLNLARQASAAGVRRFIFISSIGVNGAETSLKPFNESSEPQPHSSYAQSKWEAEEGLRNLAKEEGMDVVIIRPPLVYGPRAPGNFGRMSSIVARGVPLPLGGIHNKRSFVALDNLVDLIITCIDHSSAANQTFMVSDGEDLSTTELLQRMAMALGKPVQLYTVPTCILKVGAIMIGKRYMLQQLLGSLQIDISKARSLLGWQPPLSVDEGLRRMIEDIRVGVNKK